MWTVLAAESSCLIPTFDVDSISIADPGREGSPSESLVIPFPLSLLKPILVFGLEGAGLLSFASACERVDKDNLDGAGSLNTLEAIRDVLAGGRGVIIDVEGRDTAVDAGGRGLVGDGGLDFADEAVVGRANEENDWDLRRCAKVLPGVVGGAPPPEETQRLT